MKSKIILLAGCLWAGQLQAQNIIGGGSVRGGSVRGTTNGVYRAKFSGAASERRLEVNLVNSSLTVTGYSGDELIVEVDGMNPLPERAKGLKPLSGAGADNTGVGMAMSVEGGTIKLTKTTKQDHDYRIKIPKNTALKITETAFWGGKDYVISDLEGEIEVKTTTSDVEIRNVTGPVVGNSTSGNFEVVFSKLNQDQPCAISLISGELDITMPADTKAHLRAKTITGEIYTDFEVSQPSKEKDLKRVGGSWDTVFDLNGGGADLRIESISGNVYIRKKK